MPPVPVHVRTALLSAKTSSEAIHHLYMAFKDRDSKHSIPYLCRRAGISSTGYLSDVMKGKRRLHRKYAETLPEAFNLEGLAASYLRLLIAIDNEKDATRARILRRRLTPARKSLSIETRRAEGHLDRFFLAIEVFCAFGLFHNQPTKKDLIRYFKNREHQEVDGAISMLIHMKMIEASPSGLRLLCEHVDFSESAKGMTHLEYLRRAFADGARNAEKWFPRRDSAIIESTTISARIEELRQALPRLREEMALVRADLESADADVLVRFNVQIYPID